jgi:MFS family permease
MNFQITTALMAREEFHRGAGSFGLLTTALAVGSLTGALLAARRRGAPRQALLIGAGVAFGVFECVTALMPTYGTFMLLLIPTGMCMITFGMAANSTLQLGSASHMRGRVMALYSFVFIGGAPLASPLVGWVAELWGPRWSILLGGLISLVATAGAGVLLVRRQKLKVRAHIRPRPHLHVHPADVPAARMEPKVLTDLRTG